jgi:glycosyltransferase involved in cell wall biosynthesis
MRVLLISDGNDNGGNGSALRRAISRHTDWQVRHVRRRPSFIGYEKDLEWPRKTPAPRALLEFWRGADVAILLGGFRVAQALPGYDQKPKVMYHLGQSFRDNAEPYMARCRSEGIPQLVTTFDLLGYGPDLAWLPMVCDVDRMELERRAYRPGSRPRVMQTPAARGPNQTDQFVEAMRGVEGIDVALVEGVPLDVALRHKAQADILFDSFDPWYGLSAIEAMGMGIPVVAGTGSDEIAGRIQETLGTIPFIPATPETVREVMERLARDRTLRERFKMIGHEVVQRFHAEERVVERLAPFIGQARSAR